MLLGTASLLERCQPAWSSSSTACRPGATSAEMAARCRFIAAILQNGRIRPAALPLAGQAAPKIVGGCGTLVVRGRRPGAALGPAAGDLVLLPAPAFVAEPDFYVDGIEVMRLCDRLQAGRPVFLRNNRLSGILFLQDEPECFRTSAQIVQDALPVALFIIARPGISV